EEAAQVYRDMLEVNTRAGLPQAWAETQNNLGTVLKHQADRARADKAVALLDDAVQAFRSALEVDTKHDLPQAWARTQNNLGIALADEAVRARGDKSVALF